MIQWFKTKFHYLPLIILIVLLSSSWVFLKNNQELSREELHTTLQEKVQIALSDYIEKKYPHITHIIFHKVWTKNTNILNKIQIFFTYSLKTKGEDGGHLLANGQALLYLSDTNENHWVLNDFQVTNSFLEFQEPLIIKSAEN